MADDKTTPTTGTVQYADRGWYVALEFEVNKEFRNGAEAVKMSKSHPGFQKLNVVGGGVLYRNIYRENQMRLFWELWSQLWDCKVRRVYSCGRELAPEEVKYYSKYLTPPKKEA